MQPRLKGREVPPREETRAGFEAAENKQCTQAGGIYLTAEEGACTDPALCCVPVRLGQGLYPQTLPQLCGCRHPTSCRSGTPQPISEMQQAEGLPEGHACKYIPSGRKRSPAQPRGLSLSVRKHSRRQAHSYAPCRGHAPCRGGKTAGLTLPFPTQ